MYVKWINICKSYEEGGLNIKEIISWNKVIRLKYLWEICDNRGGNWRRWVILYYLKGGLFWDVIFI